MVVLSSSGKDALDSLAAKSGADPTFSSFVFAATTAEKEIYSKGVGYKTLNDPSSGEISDANVFWICSQSKMITHIAALQLIEKGKLGFEEPVSKYLPEFANTVVLDNALVKNSSFKPAKEAVRIKHLLNFTSGLFYPMGEFLPDRQLPPYSSTHDKDDPLGKFFSMLKGDLPGIPLQFEPGTDYTYGWSSDVLGFVVEKASGTTLEKYFKDNIFSPLGMKTSFYLTPELKAKLVDLTFRQDGKPELWADRARLFEVDPENIKLHFGGVGLYSSTKDYLTLLRHILQIHAGTASSPILTQETVFGLFKPALNDKGVASINQLLSFDQSTPNEGHQWSTGLAVTTIDWPTGRKKGTAHWSGWATTFHFVDPATGIAAVFSSQLIPPLDQKMATLYAEFETLLYKGLN